MSSVVQSGRIGYWGWHPDVFVEEVIQPKMITEQQRQGLQEYANLIHAKEKRHASFLTGSKVILTEEELDYSMKYGLSIQAGQGCGKDTFLSWIMWHFLACFPNPKIIATAPTAAQLETILWAELFKWSHDTNLLHDFKIQSDKIFLKEFEGKNWFAIWKTINAKASPDEQAVTLAGYHEDYMMFGIDEGSGVPDPVYRPIEGALTQRCNIAVVIFNPTKNVGYAIETQTKFRKHWVCLHWDSEESELVTADHIARMREKYGRNSNMYRIRVKGLPPISDESTLIDIGWVLDAVDRDTELDEENWKRCSGLDVAGGGAHKTILVWGQQNTMQGLEECSESRSKDIALWTYDKMLEQSINEIAVDSNGVGAPVCEYLEDLGVVVIWVNAADAADDGDRFEKIRDEIWWMAREEFEKGLPSILNHDDLIAQLSSIKYEDQRGPKGKIKVQSKQELKKEQGILSPDEADAYCLWRYCTKVAGKIFSLQIKPKPRPSLNWLEI